MLSLPTRPATWLRNTGTSYLSFALVYFTAAPFPVASHVYKIRHTLEAQFITRGTQCGFMPFLPGLLLLPRQPSIWNVLRTTRRLVKLALRTKHYLYSSQNVSSSLLLFLFSQGGLLETASTRAPLALRVAQKTYARGLRSYYDDAAVVNLLLRFLETLFKTRVSLLVSRSPYMAISTHEVATIALFRARITSWLGQSSMQWNYVSTILLLLFKTADATILTSWLHTKLSKMSLFGHGRFLSTLFFFLGIFYDLQCSTYGIVGIKVRVAGKISVAGNARKRSLQFNRGKTSSGSINTKVSSDFYLVRTSTGCLGLTVWLFYE